MTKSIGCDLKTCERALEDYLAGHALVRPLPAGPSLVHFESYSDTDRIVKLSFAIKVF